MELNETDIDTSELSALISNDIQYHFDELLDANVCETSLSRSMIVRSEMSHKRQLNTMFRRGVRNKGEGERRIGIASGV